MLPTSKISGVKMAIFEQIYESLNFKEIEKK